MKRAIAALIVLGMTPAMADPMPKALPEIQALSQKLISEIDQGVACSASVIRLTQEIAQKDARIKELEAAAAAKPDEPKK